MGFKKSQVKNLFIPKYLNSSNSPLEEKERDQEIASMVTHNGVLYYGNQNNQIRSLKLSNMEPLVPFEPSHEDPITSLSIINNQLLSS